MGRSIDKNDVDIRKLFRWGKQVKLNIFGNEVTLFIRIVGDADVNQARVYALRRSSELRKKLHQLDSDERIAFITEKDVLTKDDLVTMILTLSAKNIMSEAADKVNIPLPTEPASDASLEEQEDYQRKLDEYPILRETTIQNFMDQRLKEEKQKLETIEKDTLYDQYVHMGINQLCEIEMLNAFREFTTFKSLYVDDQYSTRLFEDINDFRNLSSDVKVELIQAYVDLDIDGEVLKKSLAQTQ